MALLSIHFCMLQFRMIIGKTGINFEFFLLSKHIFLISNIYISITVLISLVKKIKAAIIQPYGVIILSLFINTFLIRLDQKHVQTTMSLL